MFASCEKNVNARTTAVAAASSRLPSSALSALRDASSPLRRKAIAF
jgi:hypothetical protein